MGETVEWPVLVGGPADGEPVPDWREAKVATSPLDETLGVVRYADLKVLVGSRAVRFVTPVGNQSERIARCLDALVDHALEGSAIFDAQARVIEALAAWSHAALRGDGSSQRLASELRAARHALKRGQGRLKMADGKYGRLFTEGDVLALVRYAVMRCYTEGAEEVSQDAEGNQIDCGQRLLADFEAESQAAGEGGMASAVEAAMGQATLTFPADEPLFLLRGQDALAPHSVRHYALLADDPTAVSEEHRVAAFKAADVFTEWQAANPGRVGIPD